MKFKVICLTFCCNRCNSLTEVRTDKNHSGQNLPDKRPPDKTPRTKTPREQLRENLYMGLLSGFFVLGLLKIGVSEMCDVLFWEVPGCVTKCERGRGSKLAKNSVTYFMDGPTAHPAGSGGRQCGRHGGLFHLSWKP